MTRPLPAVVRATVDTALHTAVRRWPTRLREGMAAEWAAELHMIMHDPRSSAGQRSWRSLGYALSLAFARGPESESRRYLMRRVLTLTGAMGAAPWILLCYALIASIAFDLLGTAASKGWQLFYGPPSEVGGVRDIVPSDPPEYLVEMVAAAFGAVAIGLTGWWLARRAPLRTPHPGLAGLYLTVLLAVGCLTAVGLGLTAATGRGGGNVLLGVLAWTGVLLVTSTAVAGQRVRRKGAAGGTVAAAISVGGALAWLSGAMASRPPETTLVEAVLKGHGPDLFPHVLLAVTVFAVSYLIAWRQPVSAPLPPEPTPAQATPAEAMARRAGTAAE